MQKELDGKKIVIGALVILGVILGVIFVVSRMVKLGNSGKPGDTTISSTSPTPIASQVTVAQPDPNLPKTNQTSKEYLDNQSRIELTEAPEQAHRTASAGLLKVMPYQGKLFYFDYDTDVFAYRVTFNKDQVIEANKEFDSWLKSNGVEDKAWLFNLQIKYK